RTYWSEQWMSRRSVIKPAIRVYRMSDAKSPSDLSMDEILAAIRRIIADDEQSSAAASASGAAVARGPSAAGAAAGTAGPGSSGPATAAADVPARPAEDDVLE